MNRLASRLGNGKTLCGPNSTASVGNLNLVLRAINEGPASTVLPTRYDAANSRRYSAEVKQPRHVVAE